MRKRCSADAIGAAIWEGVGGMWNPGGLPEETEKRKKQKRDYMEEMEVFKAFEPAETQHQHQVYKASRCVAAKGVGSGNEGNNVDEDRKKAFDAGNFLDKGSFDTRSLDSGSFEVRCNPAFYGAEIITLDYRMHTGFSPEDLTKLLSFIRENYRHAYNCVLAGVLSAYKNTPKWDVWMEETKHFLRIDFAEKEELHLYIGLPVVDLAFCDGKALWGLTFPGGTNKLSLEHGFCMVFEQEKPLVLADNDFPVILQWWDYYCTDGNIVTFSETQTTEDFQENDRMKSEIIKSETEKPVTANSEIKIESERLSAADYMDFLKRTNLGAQYPKERFEERIAKLVANVSVSLVARNARGRIVGVLFGLTDYAYWLYVTDLGVDRDYEGQGIGRRLMKTAHELAGGEKDIAVYLIANDKAIPFYEKLGMEKADDVMQYNHVEWTDFTVE